LSIASGHRLAANQRCSLTTGIAIWKRKRTRNLRATIFEQRFACAAIAKVAIGIASGDHFSFALRN
jgi:hypothetical protein